MFLQIRTLSWREVSQFAQRDTAGWWQRQVSSLALLTAPPPWPDPLAFDWGPWWPRWTWGPLCCDADRTFILTVNWQLALTPLWLSESQTQVWQACKWRPVHHVCVQGPTARVFCFWRMTDTVSRVCSLGCGSLHSLPATRGCFSLFSFPLVFFLCPWSFFTPHR